MAWVPGTRPPISSVNCCRLCSRGDGCNATSIIWLALSGGVAAMQVRLKRRISHSFTERIRSALEMNSCKRAKTLSQRTRRNAAECAEEQFSLLGWEWVHLV